MLKAPSADDLLKRTNEYLENYTLEGSKPEIKDRLRELIMPALQNSRNVQSALAGWQPVVGNSFIRKLKNFILLKAKAVIINVIEKTINRQQKYNEALYQAIDELQKENAELKQRLAKVENA